MNYVPGLAPGAIWQVQVFGAPTNLDEGAPLSFGTTQLLVGDGEAVASEPLVYGPVGLHHFRSFMSIYTDGELTEVAPGQFCVGRKVWREMAHVLDIYFEDYGCISVEGLEAVDGQLQSVRWEVEPFVFDDEVSPSGE